MRPAARQRAGLALLRGLSLPVLQPMRLALLLALPLAALLASWPAPADAAGGFHGAPHALRPKAAPHGGGTQAAGAAPAHDPAQVDPPLLRERPPGAQAEDSAAGATAGRTEHVVRPFPTGPHIEVVLTGNAAVDGLHLEMLRSDLSGRIDPDRVRMLSMADDALSDSRLAAGLGDAAQGPQAAVAADLRRLQGDVDAPTLARVLHRLYGDVLLLVAHHEPDGTVVFAGRNGRPVRIAASVWRQAAQEAGVQLQLLGCHSARWSASGYRDALNSLDAVDALLRVHSGRPQTGLDLMAALSSPDQVYRIDAAAWLQQRQAQVVGPDGASPVSGFSWYGPRVRTPTPTSAPPADSQPGFDRAHTSLWLSGLLAASLVAGGLLTPWSRLAALDEKPRVWAPCLLHGAVVAAWMAVWSRAIVGPMAGSWAAAGLLAAALAVAWTAWRLLRGRGPGTLLRLLWLLRAAVLALPLALVVALHADWWRPPAPVLAVLRELHAWAWTQRSLKDTGTLALLISFAGLMPALLALVLGDAIFGRLHPWRHTAHWWRALGGLGVPAWRRWAAVRARVQLEAAIWRDTQQLPGWAQLQVLARFTAADPWCGGAPCGWQLARLPLARGDELFVLVRESHPFVHGLPERLMHRHRAGDLPATALPALVAAREWWLRGTDYLPLGPCLAPVMAGLLLVGAAAAAAMDLWVIPPYRGDDLMAFAGALLALAAWPLLLIARRALHRWRLQCARPDTHKPAPGAAG